MPIRILLADDDALIRESLRIIIGSDAEFEILGAVENGEEALAHCLKEDIDVVLMDARMPVMDGVTATRAITAQTNTKVLILSTFDEDELIIQAMNHGARGYILKNARIESIKDALRAVHGGNTVLQDSVLDILMQSREEEPVQGGIQFGDFSPREREVIEAVAEGLSNRDIAAKLFLSEGTVKNHITSIMNKTGLQHRTQIAVHYIKGLL